MHLGNFTFRFKQSNKPPDEIKTKNYHPYYSANKKSGELRR